MGKNVIPPPERESLWVGFLKKFTDPIIVILLVVFGLSVGISLYEIMTIGKDWSILVEPMGILIALLLATGVGFIFEVKAEKEFRVLNRKKDERLAKVVRWLYAEDMRHGKPKTMNIQKKDVVVGDIVKLESGDEIPADGELLEAVSLHVDESSFTGELYTRKSVEEDKECESTYPSNFLLRGTTIIEGSAVYRVTAVGMDTEEGRGAKIMQEESDVETPLNHQLNKLGNWITKASYIVAGLIIVGRLLYFFFFDGNDDHDLFSIMEFSLNSLMIAVTLIVVAVPEGLPMSVTISLALSMRRMLKENNLVRKLHACETMGAATVICTDKTGTLTQNKLRVMDQEIYVDEDIIAAVVAIDSTAELAMAKGDVGHVTIGNPTEGALLSWLERIMGIDYSHFRHGAEVMEQEPFSSEQKRMTTIARRRRTGVTYRFVKGAPEILLDMCDEIAGDHTKEEVEERLKEMQSQGKRTLAFAFQIIENFDPSTHTIKELEKDGRNLAGSPLVFAGFVGMADPVREDVKAAIDQCKEAGVRVIMVTGDVALTANEIAKEVGIMNEEDGTQLITGPEFALMSDDDIKSNVLPKLKVLSRARPADKARLVTLLQETGEVVAVTGDGTNDAPALKKAQVGLSMGDGTARAKEASDITIIDNSFVSINTAILWGRSLYLNIRRFILFQMTINICACLIVMFGAFMGLDSPLNVTQMLWVNLIMDTFAAIALSSLPADPKVMRDKPREPESMIIDPGMAKQMLGTGLLFFLLLFGLWQLLWHIDIQSVGELLNPDTWKSYVENFFVFTHSKTHLSKYELGIFFTFFVLLQFWNMFNARYFRTDRSAILDILSILGIRKRTGRELGRGFIIIALVIIVGQVAIVNYFGDMFGVSALSANDWALALLITCPALFVFDLTRVLRKTDVFFYF